MSRCSEPTPFTTNSTTANVASSGSNVTLLAARVGRRGAYIFNDSTQILYVKLGATATTTSFTHKMAAGDVWRVEPHEYNGIIDGIWASANGFARVTEIY